MMGLKAVVGSNSDLALLRQLASDADVVFACVSGSFIFLDRRHYIHIRYRQIQMISMLQRQS